MTYARYCFNLCMYVHISNYPLKELHVNFTYMITCFTEVMEKEFEFCLRSECKSCKKYH